MKIVIELSGGLVRSVRYADGEASGEVPDPVVLDYDTEGGQDELMARLEDAETGQEEFVYVTCPDVVKMDPEAFEALYGAEEGAWLQDEAMATDAVAGSGG